jgi:cytochrome oxidase Cu insertion factor (SCO1/SenC/PrrC family)
MLMAGLALAAGCDRAPSVTPPAGPALSEASVVVRPEAPPRTGPEVDPKGACCDRDAVADGTGKGTRPAEAESLPAGVTIPDVGLVDQDGRRVRFGDDLLKGKIVAVNFIFTSCKGICPPLGANFARLRERLGGLAGDGVQLISVSVDPQNDTPQRLREWREGFGRGGPGWTLLTGTKHDVDTLLKGMGVFAADKSNHSPFILLGDGRTGKWTRVHGLTAPEQLAEMIIGMHDAARAAGPSAPARPDEAGTAGAPGRPPAQAAAPSPAEKYFTNVALINQYGERQRLHSDLLKGKIVVINSFFSTCKGSCPVMLSSFAAIQEHFADRIGKDLFLISITVDPKTDTPEVLAALAGQWKARPGWQLLTGDKADVDAALHKLGMRVDNKESHSNIFLIGNEATGLWKKARGLSKPEALIPLIDEVLNDKRP